MLKRFITSMLVFWVSAALLGVVICWQIGNTAVAAFGLIRIASISSLLVLAGLVLTWRVTWLPKLQEAYEGSAQAEHIAELRERGQKPEHYGGMERLTFALSVLTGIAVASAIVQLYLGMWTSTWAVGICFGSGVAVFILFFYMLTVMHGIERERIRKLRAEAEAKHSTPAPSSVVA